MTAHVHVRLHRPGRRNGTVVNHLEGRGHVVLPLNWSSINLRLFCHHLQLQLQLQFFRSVPLLQPTNNQQSRLFTKLDPHEGFKGHVVLARVRHHPERQ